MDKKILPMKNPPITSYHYHADLLSVILNDEENYKWLYNNYIQLEVPPINGYDDNLRFDYYLPASVWKTCPFIYYQRVSRDFIEGNFESIIDFIIKSIDLNYYVYLDLDRYFFPHGPYYKRISYIHDVFVYGYDLENKILYITDYDKNNIYTKFEIDFENFTNSYLSVFLTREDYCVNGVELISPRKRWYHFDITSIIDGINDYLISENTNKKFIYEQYRRTFHGKFLHGMDIYQNIKYFINTTKNKNLESRIFHVLWEHKKLMLMRINYLGENGYLNNSKIIYNRYKEIEIKASAIKTLYVKYYLTSDKKVLNQILNAIKWIEEKEESVLLYMLENIYNKPRKCIDSYIVQHSYKGSIARFVGEEFVMPKEVQVSLDKKVTVNWISNSDIVSIKRCDDKTTIRFEKKGFASIDGFDNLNKKIAVFNVKSKQSNFNTNIDNYINIMSGNWIIDYDGKLECEGLLGLGHNDAFYMSDAFINDCIFESDVMICNHGAAALIFRANSDVTEFYRVLLDSQGTMKFLIPGKELHVEQIDVEIRVWYHLKIVAKQNKIKVYLDDKLIFDFVDNLYDSGYLGLSLFDGVVCFQNVLYYKI